MYCPLHEDTHRSAGINLDTGLWNCLGGCGGGRVGELMLRRAEWRDPPSSSNGHAKMTIRRRKVAQEQIDEDMVKTWMRNLNEREDALDALQMKRHLHRDTLIKWEIGWDPRRNCYTIPVRDRKGTILNIRRYMLNPPDERRKMWSVGGMGSPVLYPLSVINDDPKYIVICEGEWDAMITMQNGFPAITRTGAAKVWKADWGKLFKGRIVYLCHDSDKAGEAGNRIAGRALSKVAKEVKVVRLPYPIEAKNGKDLTDFFESFQASDFQKLLDQALPFGKEAGVEEPQEARVLDAFDAKLRGKPLRFNVTIKGRREPGYNIPKRVRYTCTKDKGAVCSICPLMAADGDDEIQLAPNDAVALEMVGSTHEQLTKILTKRYGIPVRCEKLTLERVEDQSVEILLGRPSIDLGGTSAGDYKTIKITSVGRHDTLPNNTVQVTGAPHPDPRTQQNEFLAWGVNRLQTSIDLYEPTRATLAALRRFRPTRGQAPLAKLAEIARELEQHVTRIYGRPEMHAAMDLVFHSALAFKFGNQFVGRGWLELLVVGDTRTGKSEAAARMCEHYGAGEVVSCESASFAGIVGGAQQIGNKEWMITWGAIPINDRRLVVLDEVGGLQPYEIAQMSSVRSSGVAELTKIAQERTQARTRLIWLGNPRDASMGSFTYGVQAIKPLIGNPEDIARFDIAMSVAEEEVDSKLINAERKEGQLRYSTELCHDLVRWVWSRTPDQVRFTTPARQRVYAAATSMGKRYIPDPPLVQVANVRFKIARVAVAIAGRLFSSNEAGTHIVVLPAHVDAAVQFIDRLYGMPGFGYRTVSEERINDKRSAEARSDHVHAYLHSRKGLAKFLKSNSSFRRQDLEETLNMDREEANGVISALWDSRMLRKDKGDIKVEPVLQSLLRSMKT